jgi:hypothetical protein
MLALSFSQFDLKADIGALATWTSIASRSAKILGNQSRVAC